MNTCLMEAVRWFKNGDHPRDDVYRVFEDTGIKPDFPREGAVVRYFCHPGVSSFHICIECGSIMGEHGWIDCGGDGLVVCPGDMIIDVGPGDFQVMSADHFTRFLLGA